jgi:hypothetical protein
MFSIIKDNNKTVEVNIDKTKNRQSINTTSVNQLRRTTVKAASLTTNIKLMETNF